MILRENIALTWNIKGIIAMKNSTKISGSMATDVKGYITGGKMYNFLFQKLLLVGLTDFSQTW